MQVVVTNAVVTNTGDAAIFAGIRSALIETGVSTAEEIVLLDSNARRTRKLYPEWTIVQQSTVAPPIRPSKITHVLSSMKLRFARSLATQRPWAIGVLRLPIFRRSSVARAYAAMARADVVVSTGGTYLVDHYDFEFRAVELELAHALGKPVVLWTQSMGPFRDARSVSAIRRIAAVTGPVFLRDDRSQASWDRQCAGPIRSAVVPDVAFALTASDSMRPRLRRVLVSVRHWAHPGPDGEVFDDSAYVSAMRRAADLALAADHEVTAVSTCQGVPGYHDDSRKALEIFEGMRVEVDRAFHRPDELISLAGTAAIVVTTRMHLAILSLLSGTPTIAIAYEFKTLELFHSLGLGEFAISIGDVTDAWMEKTIQSVLEAPHRAALSQAQIKQLHDQAVRPALELPVALTPIE